MSIDIRQITELKFTKNGTNTKYPSSKPNCFIVDVFDKKYNVTYTNHYMEFGEYELIMELKGFYETKKMNKKELVKLISCIESYTEERVGEAIFDATYDG